MSARASLAVALGLALALVACDDDTVVCGQGTLRIDGVCLPATTIDESSCGPGTHLDDLTGECIADAPPASCVGTCIAEEVADDGSVSCVCGVGGVRDGCHCLGLSACPPPTLGRVSLCGQLYDASSGDAVFGARTDESCDPESPTDTGPCALRVAVYDALELAADPAAAEPLEANVVELDDCGHVWLSSVIVPLSGVVAVVVDDAGDDAYVRSATVVAVEAGQRYPDLPVLLLSREADAAWTTAAGDPFGSDTLAQRGVAMTRSISAGAPVVDAQLTCGGEPADAYYFADLERWSAAAIDPARERTGFNGAVLSTTACLSPGIDGGLDAACEWPSQAAAPIPGLFVSEELIAHVAGDPAIPCP